MLRAPGASDTGEVMGEPQGQARAAGRKSFQEPNRQGHHVEAKRQACANRMIGEALYQQTRMIMRKMGSDFKGRRINIRKWAGCECGIKMGENGEEWETISVSLWRMGLWGAFSKHVLASTYEIFAVLMDHNRGEVNPRRKLRIDTTGNARSQASINAMVETTGWVIAPRALVEVNASLGREGNWRKFPPLPMDIWEEAGYYTRKSNTIYVMIG